ncbi:MAG: CapA family protein [Pirellulaceae bacterium]|nr:CapA family protein [Pirellulaceae bacterium]
MLSAASNGEALVRSGNMRTDAHTIEDCNQTAAAGSSPLMTVSLCGDVMTGRGIDQALRHPGDPTLYETFVKDAREYLALAERAHGPIPRPLDEAYLWGAAATEWNRTRPDARIINLETSITTSGDSWPRKAVHYRMHPRNIGCLQSANISCCALANNHVLDWGYAGLCQTLETLWQAKLPFAGAGRNLSEAASPVVQSLHGKGRMIVFALGSVTSGIPWAWAAGDSHPGVNLWEGWPADRLRRLRAAVVRLKRQGDLVIVSIHWGSNWEHVIPAERQELAHRLIDEASVDLVFGHSSHHVQGIEVYRQRLILYGCGDFLNDYEGISGYEAFRGDLGLLYFATVDPATGRLVRLEMLPTQVRRMSVQRASPADAEWLAESLRRDCRPFGTRVDIGQDGRLHLRWHDDFEPGLAC